jgi:hypothetical protein
MEGLKETTDPTHSAKSPPPASGSVPDQNLRDHTKLVSPGRHFVRLMFGAGTW